MKQIENTISHHPDDSTLGWVIYEPFQVEPPSGIEGLEYKNDRFAKVYPNPLSSDGSVLYIEAERIIDRVHLFDMQGRRVFSLKDPGKSNLNIDLNSLHSGVYFLQIHSGN